MLLLAVVQVGEYGDVELITGVETKRGFGGVRTGLCTRRQGKPRRNDIREKKVGKGFKDKW
jgi:hypothetical protein